MLVCPKCQFENPNTNKFCQKCGTSLTHKTCHDCESLVPLSEELCPNCGAAEGTVWWAVISNAPDWQNKASQLVAVHEAAKETTSEPLSTHSELEPTDIRAQDLEPLTTSKRAVNESAIEKDILNVDLADNPSVKKATKQDEPGENQVHPLRLSSVSEEGASQSSVVTNNEQPAFSSPSVSGGKEGGADNKQDDRENGISWETAQPMPTSAVYLDPQQRYRLLEPLPPLMYTAVGTFQVRVLDTQPFQKSPLEALTAWNVECGMRNAQVFQQSAISNPQSEVSLGVPAIAQPYLALQRQFYPTLPEIHDAWYQDGLSIVLLEDRSKWQLLGDLWGNNNLPMLQILYWLDEMVKLWSALEPWKCRQSLLEVTNLRVDEDQTMSLQQLYPDPKDATLTLQDLGKMWQTLFHQSQRTQFGSLEQVFRDLRLGEIVTIEQLRSRLEAIAHELQEVTEMPEEPASPAMPETTSPLIPNLQPSTPEKAVGEGGDGDDTPTVILPMQLLSLEDSGCTDVGRKREHNEDYFGIQTQSTKQENPMGRTVQARGLYILCDGMGGHEFGEVASVMAVETLRRYFEANWHDQLPEEKTIREAVLLANKAIYDVNQQNSRSGSGRMGTTLVMLLIQDTKIAVAHVGDSRLYRLSRKRGLEQVTVDHEVGQREIQRGVDPAIAYSRLDAYQLTQALGPRDENSVHPDVQFVELNEDTLLLLCSDGLSDGDLLETHWQTHLLPLLSSRANLDQGALQLIDLANQHNGHDNITAVLVRAKVRPNLDQQ